jgi:lipopolysaccharide export system permease protein
MRLLDRYLLRELLIPLGFCLGGFLIVWIAADLFRSMTIFQEHKLHGLDVAEYYLVVLPQFLVLVLPLALLLALLYALTQHARHHEISAIRAAGVSLWRLALPYFAVGLAGSAVFFVLNEFYVPDTDEQAERVLQRYEGRKIKPEERDLVRNLGFRNARDGRAWQIGAFNVKTSAMTEPQVDYARPDGSRRWLFAARAAYTNDVWVFFDVSEHIEDPRVNPLLVPSLRTNVLAKPEFTETPEQIRSTIAINNRLHSTLRSARDADIPLFQILDYLRLNPNLTGADQSWLYTKLHGRLAAPWTCVVVVLIAIPFGAASGRRNVFFGVAGSVFITFAYFILLQVGLALGASGQLPPWLAAWLPNLSFGLVGLYMTARIR